MDTKTISFALMMGALGNLLFAISNYAGNLAPGIALDFSLLAVFIAGFYGGSSVGFVSGLLAGIMPGIVFGPMGMSSWLGLIGLPLGKAMTGLTAGIIARSIRLGTRPYSSVLAVPATLSAYIPECLFTYSFFAYMMPILLGNGGAYIFLYFILPKALSEVAIIGFLVAGLVGNHGFNDFISRYFTRPHTIPKLEKSKLA